MCTVSVPKHPLYLLQDQSPQNPMPWRLQMPMPYCWLHFSPAPAIFGMMSKDGRLGPRSSFDYLLTVCSSSLCHNLCLPRPPCKACGIPLHPTSSHPIPLHPTHRIHPIASHTISLQSIPQHPCHPIASRLITTHLIPLSPSHPIPLHHPHHFIDSDPFPLGTVCQHLLSSGAVPPFAGKGEVGWLPRG